VVFYTVSTLISIIQCVGYFLENLIKFVASDSDLVLIKLFNI
jgi:hypothetical protein